METVLIVLVLSVVVTNPTEVLYMFVSGREAPRDLHSYKYSVSELQKEESILVRVSSTSHGRVVLEACLYNELFDVTACSRTVGFPDDVQDADLSGANCVHFG